mmetsp:Transcript_31978/g.47199  ORF Transcript_31978/g.47199 Transcript_31978/m.47199 type:complete len:100 (-) Transcript_31978:152-451(-)
MHWIVTIERNPASDDGQFNIQSTLYNLSVTFEDKEDRIVISNLLKGDITHHGDCYNAEQGRFFDVVDEACPTNAVDIRGGFVVNNSHDNYEKSDHARLP